MTDHHPAKPWINPYLAVLVGVFAVSFSALFVRLATAPPVIIATYRLLFTFLLLAPLSALERFSGVRRMSWRQRGLAAASGVFLALHLVTWFISLNYTSVASSVVIVTIQPVFVVLGSWLFFSEKVPRLALVGGGLALLGSVVIGAGDFQAGMEALWGDLLALAAAIFVSGYLLIGRRLRAGVEIHGYTFVTYGASSLVLVVASAATRAPFHPYPLRDWLLFLALAAVCTVLGHTVFNWVLRYVQASVVSVSILGEPIGAIIWASLFLGENPTPRQLAGGAFIFSGLFLFTRVTARQKSVS
ncbi:DMT family transporter [Geobacter pickeringii]|uniref:Membrane protein n=1 Tax=Geobacter pickeringii TaxID=345632 RepID=A0A0B5BHI3_9BACT|nr:DMT family transporter [Geobacter pickeringii]AJE04639.1 membrane protein [Geobacter pickeringii]